MNIKCLFGLHKYNQVHKGLCYYQKGNKEKWYFEGEVFRCVMCDKEIFEGDIRPIAKKINEVAG